MADGPADIRPASDEPATGEHLAADRVWVGVPDRGAVGEQPVPGQQPPNPATAEQPGGVVNMFVERIFFGFFSSVNQKFGFFLGIATSNYSTLPQQSNQEELWGCLFSNKTFGFFSFKNHKFDIFFRCNHYNKTRISSDIFLS